MTKNYEALWEEQGSAPGTPATGKWKVYFKSDGQYILEDDGTEHGPFNATFVITHAASHIDGGSDAIDGDKLEITWTPTNYTRDSGTPTEADSDDDLTAHLQGIDTQLEVVAPITGEIFLPASSGWPSTTNGCAANAKNEYITNDVDLYSLDFDGAATEYAQWSVWMPGNWDGGTVTADFLWSAASGSGTVIFGLQGRSYANDEVIDQAWGTAKEVTDTLLAVDDFHFSPTTAAITLAGTPAAGQFVQFRSYRDGATDTHAADVRLLGIKVYYTKA